MIEKISYFKLICDDCKINSTQVKTHQEAREKDWAISRDRKTCYCPKCAPWHRFGIDYWERDQKIKKYGNQFL